MRIYHAIGSLLGSKLLWLQLYTSLDYLYLKNAFPYSRSRELGSKLYRRVGA